MLRVKYGEALLLPLRSPRRVLEAGFWLGLLPWACTLGATVLTIVGMLFAIAVLGQHQVLFQPGTVVVGTVGVTLVLSLPWMVLLGGYFMRAIRASAQGDSWPPCDRWKEMAADGLRGVLFTLFVTPPILLPLLGGAWLAGRAGGDPLQLVGGSLLAWPLMTLSIVLGLVWGPAYVRLSVEQRLGSALDLRRSYRDLRRGWGEFLLCYFIQVVPALLLNLLMIVAGASLILIPLILLFAPAVTLYQCAITPGLLGQYYRAYMTVPEPPPMHVPGPFKLLACLLLLGIGLLPAVAPALPAAVLSGFPGWRDGLQSSLPGSARLYLLTDGYALAASASAEKDVTTLAAYLAQAPASTASPERAAARAAFRWITDRIAYDPAQTDASLTAVLKLRRANGEGFARLFQALAGGQVVRGEVRLEAFGADFSDRRHAWNALRIDGLWALVDCTWGAGSIKKKAFVKDFQDFYFLPDARQLALTHFPAEARWQLLTPTLTRQEFDDQPYIGDGFGWVGLRLLGPFQRKLPGGRAHFVVEAPPGTQFQANLGTTPVEPTREGQRYTFDAKGTGDLNVFACPGHSGDLHWVFSYEVTR